VSSLTNAPLPADAVYFGEISLSGVVRPVAQAAARLKEAQKLGFARAVLPESARGEAGEPGFALSAVDNLASLVADIAGRSPATPTAGAKRRAAARRPGYRDAAFRAGAGVCGQARR